MGAILQLPLFADLPRCDRARCDRAARPARPSRAALASIDAVPAWRPVPLALIAGGGTGDDFADADLAAERARNHRLATMINRRWLLQNVDAGARAVPVMGGGRVIGWGVATTGLRNGMPVAARPMG